MTIDKEMEMQSRFYTIWERFVADLSDEDLAATVLMVTEHKGELNDMIITEHKYRNCCSIDNGH